MQKREKILLFATVLVVVLGLALRFSPDEWSLGGMMAAGDLGDTRETFRRYARTLEESEQIRRDYQEIDVNIPERVGGKSPGNTFMDELNNLLTRQFGVPNPEINPYKIVDIDDVEDYYFVEVQIALSGSPDQMIRLLERLEENRLLIREFSLISEGRRTGDRATLNVTVARLVKHDEESLRRRDRLRRR